MKKIYIILSICFSTMLAGNSQNITKDSLSYAFGDAITGEKLSEAVQIIPNNALYGRLKGLYVMQGNNNTNVLENEASLNLRGLSTSGNDAPLVLIDGFERSLSQVTLAEIEDIRVMTDAVGSAIYGMRGANGVIIVTTKKGIKGNQTSVNYNFVVNTPFRRPEFADAQTYAKSQNEALANDKLPARYTDREIQYFAEGNEPEAYPNVDWQDWAYKDYSNSHLLDIQNQGGNEHFNYFTTINYSNSKSILDFSDYDDRYSTGNNRIHLNMRSNINVDVTPTTHLHLNLLARLIQNKRPGNDMSSYFSKLYNTPSNAFPIKTSNDVWGGNNFYDYNLIGEIADKGYIKDFRRGIFSNLSLKQELNKVLPGLYIKGAIAYDDMVQINDKRTRNYGREMVVPILDVTGEVVGTSYQPLGVPTELGWNSATNSVYSRSSIEGTLGYDIEQEAHKLSTQLHYRQTSYSPKGRNTQMKRQDIMAIANYSLSDKYIVDGVVNYSGSAVLPEGEQFNLYPAIGVGWIASKEDFLKNNSTISYLKLKASAGLSGSDLIGHDLNQQFYGINGGGYLFSNNNTGFSGIQEGSLGISDLRVEQARKIDFTAELTLFNKINVAATYFNEYRSNILVVGSTVISSMIGIEVPQLCTGEVINQGVELNLDLTDQVGDFTYGINANFTYAKNEIVSNNEGFKPETYLYKEGHSLGQLYGLESNGFFASQDEIDNFPIDQSFGELAPGDIKYSDQNNDNKVDENDIVRLGYSNYPEIYYGFNLHLGYKAFGMNALFQGVANRDLYLNTPSLHQPLANNTNISQWYLEDNIHWTPETAQEANLPRLTTEDSPNNFRKSDVWMANGNYLKLRNLQVYYDLEISKFEMLNARLFLNGSNLFSIDNMGDTDPENIGANYPSMSSYSAGIQINF